MGELQEPGPEGTCSPPESQFFVAVILVGKESTLGSSPAHRWVMYRLEPLCNDGPCFMSGLGVLPLFKAVVRLEKMSLGECVLGIS